MTDATLASETDILAGSYNSTVRDYIALLKPRVMSLVVFTGIVGLWLAPGNMHPFLAVVAVMCIALGSGAAGAINMWYDADIDKIMTRTAKRPIPAGKIPAEEALSFGVFLSATSVFIMGLAINGAAALLLAVAILFYVFVYTMGLKRRTPQNIVIGGAAGAFPPMIGWTAVTGDVSLEGMILFGLIFMWTPPHFWALSLFKCKDYADAGVPMLPVVAGDRSTRNHILAYTILMLPTALSPVAIGMSGWVYMIGALMLSLEFLRHAVRVYRNNEHASNSDAQAKAMFGFSILYLFILFVLLVIDKTYFIAVL